MKQPIEVIPPYWSAAKRHLSRSDPGMAALIRSHPKISLRKRGTAFETLLRAIVGQQISVKAAQSVWDRFRKAAGRITPDRVLELHPGELRACGFSISKITYAQDLAAHFTSRTIRPRSFSSLEDEELITALCAVRGIGRWTAEMFLIFHLHRPDVLPVGDLGLVRAVERHYLNGEAATKHHLQEIGERWRPYRTVATWYLWRSLEPKPVEY